MSALDVANNLMDSEHEARLTATGTQEIEKTALEGKESAESLRDDLTKDVGEVSTTKGAYGALKTAKGAYDVGLGAYASQEMGKTAEAVGKIPGLKKGASLGASAAKGAASMWQRGGSTFTPGPLTDEQRAGASLSEGLMRSAPSEEAGVQSGRMVGQMARSLPDEEHVPIADEAATKTTSALSDTERLAGKAMGIGEKFGVGMKALGAAGGAFDAVDDIIHGGVVGDNKAEKWGNGLTIAGTVLDFVPGMEWLGTGLNAVGAYESLKGESDASDTQTQQNQQRMKQITKPSPAVHSWSQMGLVSSMAPDAVHSMAAVSHF